MAEALFRAAKDLQAAGKLAEACAKYMESHRLEPKPGTILNVATCHEQEGRTATAWADYTEAATFAARAKQADRERFARGKIEELEKKLSYVTFRFPQVVGLEILLDGKTLTTASAGTRVPIDPGEHALEATAPGKVAWSSRVTVEQGPSERSIVVPALTDEAAGGGAAPGKLPETSPPAEEKRSDGSTQRAVGWVTVGVGVAGLGAGALFGVQTLEEKSTVDDNCVGSRCNPIGLNANEDAQRSAALSTVGFVVGGAALVTGIVLLVSAPRAHSKASKVSWTFAGGPSGGGIHGVW
jgi:hypothetical protein